ncbi:hypothetical protein, partial [Streptomyces himastatinicus]|uniref:hypothetical protein n=1 Tax=Streptomyces himastatinicus TaxID=998084 RepID=UPI0001B4F4EA
MPPSRRAQRLAAVTPDTERAIAYLHTQGETTMAEAVQTTLDYATQAATARAHEVARDKKANPNKSINVGEPFLHHVRSSAADQGVEQTAFVLEKLGEFVNGTWMPERPERAPHRGAPTPGFLNVRVPADLWQSADELAKDPAAVEERGYKLTARQVVIA